MVDSFLKTTLKYFLTQKFVSMKLKAGDKLMCKKDFKTIKNGIILKSLYKDKQYFIKKVNTKSYVISSELGASDIYFLFEYSYGHNYIWEYFYTIHELRNIKLKTII